MALSHLHLKVSRKEVTFMTIMKLPEDVKEVGIMGVLENEIWAVN